MEEIMIVLEELERRRAELLKQKERKISEIEKCDDKIAYLNYIITQYNCGKKFRQEYIKGYEEILATKKLPNNISLFFDSCDNKMVKHIECMIAKLKRENSEIEKSKIVVATQMQNEKRRKVVLNQENRKIDLQILEIDGEIKSKATSHAKVKNIENMRGKRALK